MRVTRMVQMFIFDYAVSRKNLRQLEISKKRFLDKLKEGLGGLRLARKISQKDSLISSRKVWAECDLPVSRRLTLATVRNDDSFRGLAALGAHGFNLLYDVHAFYDLTKDDVLAVQPRGGDGAEEELGSVGVGTGVGHGQDAGPFVLVDEVLVRKLLAVDRLTTSSVASSEVSSLAHELRDDTMKAASLEVQGFAALAHTLLSSAKAAKVLRCLGSITFEANDDAACWRAADGHVHVHF